MDVGGGSGNFHKSEGLMRSPGSNSERVSLAARARRWLAGVRRHRRTTRPPVSLDLHQQLILLTVASRGPCSFQRLLVEVGNLRPVTPAELTFALLLLDAAGLIERATEQALSHGRRPYTLTRRGSRATRIIPTPPRSALDVYL